MRIAWTDDGNYHRAYLTKPIKLALMDFGGTPSMFLVRDLGYIKQHHTHFAGSLYGSVSDAPTKTFDTLDEAKHYIEDYATAGIMGRLLDM